MFSSVFQRSEAGSRTNSQTSSSQSRPPLQKLLLRNLPSYRENSAASPTSSNRSRRSASYLDSTSSTSSPIDRNSISSPLPLITRRSTHHDSPERLSPSALTKPSGLREHTSLQPILRSASSPSSSSPSSSSKPSPRPQSSITTSRSATSLQLDPRQQNLDDWHRYPLVRQLSPIVEQDYVSPDALRLSVPLPPSASDHDASSSDGPPSSSVIRNASVRSDVTRPSPVYSAHTAFVSRPLNRSLSQTSSRTQRSTGSTPISAIAPAIPPLEFTPAFPGPHSSSSVQDDSFPMPRVKPLSLSASSFDYRSEDTYSLHPESFITANEEGDGSDQESQVDTLQAPRRVSIRSEEPLAGPSRLSRQSFSFSTHITAAPEIPRPVSTIVSWWAEPQAAPSVQSRPLRTSPRITPACWLFWAGFLCPLMWIIGGWYFTIFQETGEDWNSVIPLPSFSAAKEDGQKSFIPFPVKAVHKPRSKAILPLWARDNANLSEATLGNLSHEEGMIVQRLWRGYPFVDKPDERPESVHGRFFRALRELPIFRINLIGPPEWKCRRRLDPWIWRCRVAIFLFMITCIVALTICFALLIPRTHVSTS